MARLELAVECDEAFRVSHFFVRDELSAPFEIWLQVVTPNAAVDSNALIDSRAAFLIDDERPDKKVMGPQIWTGICTQFRLLNAEPSGLSSYLVRIEPELARLRYRRTCCSYPEKSKQKIVKDLFAAWAMASSVSVKATGAAFTSQPPFTLQYHESDLTFLSRLLEDAAVSYRFETPATAADDWPCTEGTMLVLDDLPKRSGTRPSIVVAVAGENETSDYAVKVQLDHDLRSHDATVVDYNFRQPKNLGIDQFKSKHSAAKPLHKNYTNRMYRQGAVMDTRGDKPAVISQAAQRWVDARCGDARVVRFETNAFDLVPGTIFNIESHSLVSDSDMLMVTQLTLEGEANDQWHGSVSAVWADAPYAPPRLTAKPTVHGVQSATVVKTDKLGRVAVTFPWDEETKNELAWLRMSHPYASTAHGMHALPQPNDEVLVSFLQGDPDQPLVVGSLYNETHLPPHDPGNHPERSSWRDLSGNELTLEAKSGSELIHLAATKDMNLVVEESLMTWLGKDHEQTVTGDQKSDVQGAASLTVGGDHSSKVTGKSSLDAAEGHVKYKQGYGLEAGTNAHIKAGVNAVIEAGVTLTLKAGSNFVEIGPAGVTIKGTMVMINCPGGPPGKGDGASPVAPTKPGGKPEIPS